MRTHGVFSYVYSIGKGKDMEKPTYQVMVGHIQYGLRDEYMGMTYCVDTSHDTKEGAVRAAINLDREMCDPDCEIMVRQWPFGFMQRVDYWMPKVDLPHPTEEIPF